MMYDTVGMYIEVIEWESFPETHALDFQWIDASSDRFLLLASHILSRCPASLKAAIFLINPQMSIREVPEWQMMKIESWLLDYMNSDMVMGTYWNAEYLWVDEWCVEHLIDRSDENVYYYDWYKDLDGQYGLTLWERADKALAKRRKGKSIEPLFHLR
jgi:hypothetical protein